MVLDVYGVGENGARYLPRTIGDRGDLDPRILQRQLAIRRQDANGLVECRTVLPRITAAYSHCVGS